MVPVKARRVARLLALAGLFGCSREVPPARIAIAVEPGWYPAVRLAQADLRDVPIEFLSDSTRNVQAAPTAISYAEWVAEQGAAAVVGHSGSRGSVAASTVYRERGIAQLAPIATSGELTAEGSPAFALVPSDSAEGAFIGAFVDTVLHARRAVLLYHHDQYGLGLRDGVVAELTRRGIVTADERFFAPEGTPSGSVRVERLLAAALLARPDVIILGARVGETREVVTYLRRHNIRVPVVCGDGSYVLPPSRDDRDLRVLDGVYIVRFWGADRDSASAGFARRFEARFGYPPEHSDVFTYDAVMLLGDAARNGARTGAAFRQYLLELGRQRGRYDGIAGSYMFQQGRPVTPTIEMGRVQDGLLLPAAARS